MTIEDIVKEIKVEIKREWKSIPPKCRLRHEAHRLPERLIVKLHLLDTSKN